MRFSTARLALCLAAPAVLFAAQARAQSLSQSSAYTIDAAFTHGGETFGIGPTTPVSGQAPPNYAVHDGLRHLASTVALGTGKSAPTLTVQASSLSADVSSAGLNLNVFTDRAKTNIGSITLTVSDGSGTPALQITGSGLRTEATHEVLAIDAQTNQGHTQIEQLTVTGSLVGGQTLKFSGAIGEQKVLYDSDSVTVTVGRRVRKAILPITCPLVCTLIHYDVQEQALSIVLHKAAIGRETVSGHVSLGESFAGPPSLPLGLLSALN